MSMLAHQKKSKAKGNWPNNWNKIFKNYNIFFLTQNYQIFIAQFYSDLLGQLKGPIAE